MFSKIEIGVKHLLEKQRKISMSFSKMDIFALY
jgi:hypothetical protein